MKYTTEDYVRAVVAAVAKEHGTDPARCMVLAWSSSGPGVYPLLVAADGPFRGGYVAMSIWPGKRLGELTAVKGRRFVLDQSMEDTVTRFSHVRDAFAALDKAGAVVRLSTYNGGHGWKDNPMPRLHAGLKWLFGDEPAPPPAWPGDAGKREPAATGKNLLDNGGFEQGTGSWSVVGNSGRLKVDVSRKEKKGGKQALHLSKTGGMPLDLVVQEIDKLPAAERITLRLQVKNGSTRNAWIKLWLYDEHDQPVHVEVDAAQLRQPGDWQQIEKTWTIGKARRAVLQFVMVMDGELWVDDVELVAGK